MLAFSLTVNDCQARYVIPDFSDCPLKTTGLISDM
jgi:hypothetical protein